MRSLFDNSFCNRCFRNPCCCPVIGPIGPTGPTGPTGPPGPAVPSVGGGAVLVYGGALGGFSMEPFIVTLTTDANGAPSNVIFYGFSGFPITFVGPLADTIDLGLIFLEPLLMPRQGTITSYSARFITRQLNFPINAGVHARIYQNNTPGTPGNNIFTFIPGTDFELAPRIIGTIGNPPQSDLASVVIPSGLNIAVAPGTRLLMAYYVESTQVGLSGTTEITGNGGGALALA